MPKKRKKNNKARQLAPVLHIYCEGEKTEPNYLNGYIEQSLPGNRLLKIITVENTNKNTPVQLVEEAIEAKGSKYCPEGDIFWVVYDRESKASYSADLHSKAYQMAIGNGVNVALSNVCFEIWLLLHYQYNTKAYNCFEELTKDGD